MYTNWPVLDNNIVQRPSIIVLCNFLHHDFLAAPSEHYESVMKARWKRDESSMKARWKHAERTIKLFSARYTDTIPEDHPNVWLAAGCTICQHSASRQSWLSDLNFKFSDLKSKEKKTRQLDLHKKQRHARLTVPWKLAFYQKTERTAGNLSKSFSLNF